MSETIEGLKALAKSLRETARAQGETVSHSQALEGVAKAHGFKDWNTAAAMLPHAPAGLTIDSMVRAMLVLRAEVAQHEPVHIFEWYETDEFRDWTTRGDKLIANFMTFDQFTASCLMRYAVYVLRLPFHLSRMPNFKAFADKYRHVIDSIEFMAYFEKLFPDAEQQKQGIGNHPNKPVPFTYGPLVREIQTIMKGNPGLTEDEVIEILKKSGRPLNEATARGLYRKGYAHLSREDQILHVVSTPGYQPH